MRENEKPINEMASFGPCGLSQTVAPLFKASVEAFAAQKRRPPAGQADTNC
jgi:hypothetical protein